MRKRLFFYNPGLWIVVLIIITCSCKQEHPRELKISVKFNDSVFNEEVSGKLIFLFNQDTSSSLVYGVNPYTPHPVFTYDLEHWNPISIILRIRIQSLLKKVCKRSYIWSWSICLANLDR